MDDPMAEKMAEQEVTDGDRWKIGRKQMIDALQGMPAEECSRVLIEVLVSSDAICREVFTGLIPTSRGQDNPSDLDAKKAAFGLGCGWGDEDTGTLSQYVDQSEQALADARTRIAELEADLKVSRDSNCAFIEQNTKLIRRNLALGDIPYEYGANPLCGKCDGRREP